MSFWAHSPGPSWWDCIESLNPCIQTPYGLCDSNVAQRQRTALLSPLFHKVALSERHAEDMEKFLREHFVLYPRCKIALTKQRIREGFLYDTWIGVGVYSADKIMVACCISKPLGRMKFAHEMLEEGGVVDYFCVHRSYRKMGLASFLLEELLDITAKQNRLVHVFLKEGFPLWNLPPLYTSQYIVRHREPVGDAKDYFGSMGIGTRGLIQSYTHADYLPLTKFVANLPWQLSGDSEIFSFSYRGHSVFLCMTNLFHTTVPEGKTVGELTWMLPQTAEVPLSIQRLAVETCVDCSKYDYVLVDRKIPHDSKRSWRKDASFSWYVFNYNPGGFFHVKPFWIF